MSKSLLFEPEPPSLENAAKYLVYAGGEATPASIRAYMNEPWEYPPEGTKILVVGHNGRACPQLVGRPCKTRNGMPAVMTNWSYLLRLEDEGSSWFRGWELTPERYERFKTWDR